MTAIENTRTQWLIFLISLIATAGFLYIKPEWFWVVLPFLFTSYVKANRWI